MAGGAEAADRTQALAERADDEVDVLLDPLLLGQPAAGAPKQPKEWASSTSSQAPCRFLTSTNSGNGAVSPSML